MTSIHAAAVATLLAAASLAPLAAGAKGGAGVSSRLVLHVRLDPGNYIDAATTVDASGAPAFIFGTGDVPPCAATSYSGAGQLRWSFFNKSEGKSIKLFETTAARHCESGGKGAGAVDVFVTEADAFNDVGLTVFGLSSTADSAAPLWTLPIAGCESQDGGFTTKASDRGARIVVQANCRDSGGVGTVFGVNGQTGEVEWRYNTSNELSGTDMNVQISANGDWVLYVDAYSPGTTNNATVLAGATGAVRDTTSIPLPYYSSTAAISDSGNFVAVVDEIAVNVFKWRAASAKYELVYVLAPPPGTVVRAIDEIVMSTGRDKEEMLVALYDAGNESTESVAVGIWSLVGAQLTTTWVRSGVSTFGGGMSADGDYVSVPLSDGAVVLKRGYDEEVFSFGADVMIKSSVNVVRAAGGGSDTVFLAVAGGNNDAGGKGNVGDAYAYEIIVPDAESAPSEPPCFGQFEGAPLEELCFAELLNSSTTKGLSVREYAQELVSEKLLVTYNVSAQYPVTSYAEALTLGGFSVLEYFIGGFNKPKKDLLDARTVPFLVFPPAAAGGWVAKLALAPSKFPSGKGQPEPTNNVTITVLGPLGSPLTLAVQRLATRTAAPTGAQLEALCAGATTAVGAGALPGYTVDKESPFASGVYALYYGRDAPQGTNFVAECWIGVLKKA